MIRTSVRRIATTARRAAETIAEMEAPQAHAIQMSRAQGIAQDGLISGESLLGVLHSKRRQLTNGQPLERPLSFA